MYDTTFLEVSSWRDPSGVINSISGKNTLAAKSLPRQLILSKPSRQLISSKPSRQLISNMAGMNMVRAPGRRYDEVLPT